ncbi:MAG TPA: molybdopterin-dependent oxidoreductase [Thermomicrobiales bacterium]|nr:molybdopterin-dependent oxidoreductase [Thermomicrobiales bacterium]
MPKPQKMITAIMDGKTITVPDGTLVLEAARMNGIDVPNFCYEPTLRPWGSCRMCMIEIHGRRGGIKEGCATPLTEGMEVSTHSPAAIQARQDMLRFFLIDHALDCPVCDKSGECRLQDSTYEYNVYNNPFRRPKRAEEMRAYSPLISYKLDRCVVCSQCIRVCEEIVGATAIAMAERSYHSEIVVAYGNSLEDTKCTHCGNCVAVCPVGAILDRNYTDHEWKMDHTLTTCHYCAVGCKIDARTIGMELKRMDGVLYEGVNRGYLCVKGRWAYDYAQAPDRLKTPLIRRNNRFEPASWEEALAYVALRLRDHRDGTFMGVGSTRVTTEEAYLFQLFTRAVMGTNNLDTVARYGNAPGQRALAQSFGLPATTNSIAEIRDMKCLLVAGANMPETHAIASYWVNVAVKTHGDPAALIVIDPHWNLLCDVANLWLRPKPGTDGVLLNGMAKVVLDEGLANLAFVDARAEGFAEWRASLADFTLDSVAEITGVPAEQIAAAARLYATGNGKQAAAGELATYGPSAAFFGNGLTQHRGGVDNVLALNNLALVTGNVGREWAGVNTFVGDNNTQGAADMGLTPDRLPGYVAVDDAEGRARFEELWLSRWAPDARGATRALPLPDRAGYTLTELPAALEGGKVKALYIQGEDLIGAAPNQERMERALERAAFVVVSDLFLTPTAQLADVVLPVASGFEKDGTYTNLERQIQRVRKAIPPRTGSRPDWQILTDLMQRFGYALSYRHPAQVMDEIAQLVPAYAGVTYRRIEREGLHWPVPEGGHPGTPTLYLDGFATASGKARFIPARAVLASALPDAEYPLVLMVSASLYHWGAGERTRRSVGPRALEPEPFVEVNARDAAGAGIRDGEVVRVASRQGWLELRARAVENLPPGLVRMTPHWPTQAPFNRLTGEGVEPSTGTPELKFTPVRLSRAAAVEAPAADD